ncbi:MAG: hypothetical protein HOV80_23540 [Polyangiaceae bacterium]|nr:hypothetical protein [Polyangiaceae bacterium]
MKKPPTGENRQDQTLGSAKAKVVTLNGTVVLPVEPQDRRAPKVPVYTPPFAVGGPGGETSTSPMASTGRNKPKDGSATYRSQDVVRPTNVEVDTFARACAELNAFPQDRAEILARYGIVSEEAFTETSVYYDDLIARDPALRKRFVEVGRVHYTALIAKKNQ